MNTTTKTQRGSAEFALVLILLMVIGLSLSLLGFWFASKQCESRWAESGMKADWSVFGGCVVTMKDGRKIPAANYREI